MAVLAPGAESIVLDVEIIFVVIQVGNRKDHLDLFWSGADVLQAHSVGSPGEPDRAIAILAAVGPDTDQNAPNRLIVFKSAILAFMAGAFQYPRDDLRLPVVRVFGIITGHWFFSVILSCLGEAALSVLFVLMAKKFLQSGRTAQFKVLGSFC